MKMVEESVKEKRLSRTMKTYQTLHNTVLTSETSPVKLAFSVNRVCALYETRHNTDNALAAATCISLKDRWRSSVSMLKKWQDIGEIIMHIWEKKI